MQRDQMAAPDARRGKVKCLVWDLDHTLWQGVLSEGDQATPAPGVAQIIESLDRRGILQSIASKNDAAFAMARLRQLGLADYFLYPQINWGPKSASIQQIAERLNIGVDAIAFVDDQAFERDEVAFSLPAVLCLDAADLGGLLELPELTPRFLTDESRTRRLMYVHDAARGAEEDSFAGPKEEFLAALNMTFSVAPALEVDLHRLEELTARTNQLNTTGYIYSYEELNFFRTSDRHELLVAALEDRYGPYGKIGLTLIEKSDTVWTIKLMLMSCRVMSRGVGTILLNSVMNMARARGVKLRAEMILNERNRMMYVTYKFAGFLALEKHGNTEILEHDLQGIAAVPGYVQLHLAPALSGV
ncbi:FkbH-like protein [Janthinobacterium sp. CG_23.3]|uniref:HAD-IIIC family phosphatase n=1 Tax=Janthinobacterium sp. CG_23.3 TaxID=3349634 RepID=UPI0038D4B7FA